MTISECVMLLERADESYKKEVIKLAVNQKMFDYLSSVGQSIVTNRENFVCGFRCEISELVPDNQIYVVEPNAYQTQFNPSHIEFHKLQKYKLVED